MNAETSSAADALTIAGLWAVADWESLSRLEPQSLDKHPDRISLLQMLAFSHAVLGRTADARRILLQALEAGAQHQDVLKVVAAGIMLGVARSHSRLGETERAQSHLDAAVALYPGPDALRVTWHAAWQDDILLHAADPVQARRRLRNQHAADAQNTGDPALFVTPAKIISDLAVGAPLADLPVNNSDGFGGFALVEAGGKQFVAYFDTNRDLIVAERQPEAGTAWVRHRLDEKIDWNSHKYLAMAVDPDGFLHLAGNMHASPLRYFRSTAPLAAGSFQRIDTMTGLKEDKVTYPKFFHGPDGALMFSYRHGKSGDGATHVNTWSVKTQTWRAVFNGPLLSGEGMGNAYVHGPVLGPDHLFHMCWVWRVTPDSETNHTLCYARSADLKTWSDSAGGHLSLPITERNGEVILPVAVGQGMINNNHLIGFDSLDRPMVTFQRNDAQGNTQIFVSRLENLRWKTRQITEWDYRWIFGGRGSQFFEISFLPAYPVGDGFIAQEYYHKAFGVGCFILSEDSLSVIDVSADSLVLPAALRKTDALPENLRRNITFDWGTLLRPGQASVLVWDSLTENKDRPQDNGNAPRGPLRLVTVERGQVAGSSISADATFGLPAESHEHRPTLIERVMGQLENLESELKASRITNSALQARARSGQDEDGRADKDASKSAPS